MWHIICIHLNVRYYIVFLIVHFYVRVFHIILVLSIFVEIQVHIDKRRLYCPILYEAAFRKLAGTWRHIF